MVAAIFNWIYFSRKKLPAKYLAPGILFLPSSRCSSLLYTGYIAMTNYGTGHVGSQEQAVSSLMSSALAARRRLAHLPPHSRRPARQLSMLVTDPDGNALLGTTGEPLEEVDATFDDGKAVATDGYTTLTFAEVIARTDEIVELVVPASEDPNDGALRTTDGSNAYLYTSSLEYDEAAGTMTDLRHRHGLHRHRHGRLHVAENGEELLPGWQIVVGLDNFVRALTDESIRGPLIYVTIWTFAFAIISVGSTFFLGLFLAIVFNDARMRGRKWYRVGADPALRLPRVPRRR